MNSNIMNLSSAYIYSNELLAAEEVGERCLYDLGKEDSEEGIVVSDIKNCLLWLDTAGANIGDEQEDTDETTPQFLAAASRFNRGEVELAALIYKDLRLEQKLNAEDIGIISPYRAQVTLLKEKLKQTEYDFASEDIKPTKLAVEVSTVDGFQGREKEVIVLSLVRANPEGEVGFLEDERRMNVAVTRAKRLLIIIGDSKTALRQPFIASMYTRFKENLSVVSIYDVMGAIKAELHDDSFISMHFNSGSYKERAGLKISAKEQEPEKKNKKNKKKKIKKPTPDDSTDKPEIIEVIKTVEISPEAKFEKEQKEYIQDFMNDPDATQLVFTKKMTEIERNIFLILTSQSNLATTFKKKSKIILTKESHTQVQDPKEESYSSLQNALPERSAQPREPLLTQQDIEEKRRKKHEKKQKKALIDAMDEDEFLEHLQEQNQDQKHDLDVCMFRIWNSQKRCLKSIKLLGITCKYCNVKFCSTHAFPEMHGCHDAVDHDYRNRARQPNQSGKSKADVEALKAKLRNKVKQAEEKRQPKKPEKGKKTKKK